MAQPDPVQIRFEWVVPSGGGLGPDSSTRRKHVSNATNPSGSSDHFSRPDIRLARSSGATKTKARPSRIFSRSPSSTSPSRSVRAVW